MATGTTSRSLTSTDINWRVDSDEFVYSNELCPVSAIPLSAGDDYIPASKILKDPSPFHSPDNLIWDFGDGTTYTGISAEHVYDWPGEYVVTLTVINAAGEPIRASHQETINVHDFIPTQYEYTVEKNVYDIPAGQTTNPLKINFMLSWQNYTLGTRPSPLCADGHQHHMNTGKELPSWMCGMSHSELETLETPIYTFNVYASGAESQPLDTLRFKKKKYEHLKVDWTFFSATPTLSTTPTTAVDVSLLDSLTGNPGDANTYELLYYRRDESNDIVPALSSDIGAVFMGLSGNMSCYYRDDKAKCETSREHPVNIFAQLDGMKLQDSQTVNKYNTPNAPYKNLKTLRLNNVKPRVNEPAGLAITSNGLNVQNNLGENIFRINPNKWANTEIVFTTTIQDDAGYNILDTTTFNDTNFSIELVADSTAVPTSAWSIVDASSESTNTLGSYQGVLSANQPMNNAQLSASLVYDQLSGYVTDATEGYFNVYTSSVTGEVYKYLHQDVTTFDSDRLTNNITTTIEGRGTMINTNGIISTATVTNSGTDVRRPPGVMITDLGGNGDGGKIQVTHDPLALKITDASVISGGIGYVTPSVEFITNATTPPAVNLTVTDNTATEIFAVSLADQQQNTVTWAVETGSEDRLLKINSSGNIQFATPLDDLVNTPGDCVDIKLDSDKNLWICCTNKLFWVNTSDMSIMHEIAHSASPTNLEIDADGTVYITDYLTVYAYEIVVDPEDGSVTTSTSFKYTEYPIQHMLCTHDSTYMLTVSGADGVLLTFDNPGNITTRTSNSSFGSEVDVTTSLPGQGWSNLTTGTDQNVYVMVETSGTGGRKQILHRANDGTNVKNIPTCDATYISGDSRGLVWVVDSNNTKIHFVDILASSLTTNTTPDTIEYDSISHTEFPSDYDLLRGTGDCLGFHWLQKYGYIPEQTVTLTGTSSPFNIWPACGQYTLNKYNEDHNHGATLKSYAGQPWLEYNYNLWENFIYTAVGTNESSPTSMGKLIYEKISNFAGNNSDLDDCTIDSIHSYAGVYKSDIQKYNFDYPPSIKRLMDMCSIKHKRLYGEFDYLSTTFDMYTDYENQDIRENLGSQIDFDTYMLTPGETIVAYEKFSKVFEPITVSYPTTGNVDADDNIIDMGLNTDIVSTTADQYALSAYSPLWGWNLVTPMTMNGQYINREVLYYYDFWTFNQSPTAEHVEGVINWSDAQTTDLSATSGYSAENTARFPHVTTTPEVTWSDDGEIVDNMMEHQLRVGLNMFSKESQSDCY